MQFKFTLLISLILTFVFCGSRSTAQIAISSSDYLSPLGGALVEVGVVPITLQANYLAPPSEGASQSWDYRWIEYTNPRSDPEPEDSDPAFPMANNIDEVAGTSDFTPDAPIPLRLFERYDADGRAVLGEQVVNPVTLPFFCGSCSAADSIRYQAVTNTYEEPDRLLQLPLAFEDSWTSNYTRQFDMTLFLPTFSLQEVAAQQVDSFEVENEVSGWGTLTLPNLTFSGTQDIEVLLVRQIVTKKSTYTVNGTDPPQALLDTLGVSQGQQKVITTYKFYAKGLDQPALTVTFNPGAPFPAVTVAGSIPDINPENEGQFVQQVISHGGQLRNYFLFVPPGYTGAEPTALVVALHGYSSNAAQFAWQSQLNVIADTAGFITVYPQGLLVDNAGEGGPLPPRGPGWDIPGRGPEADQDDVDFINTVVEQVANRFNIDLAKVYATGISNGGFMTSALACELPDRFAAVAMAAGSFPCERDRPIPTFVIHGTDDLLVPFGGDPNFDLPPVPQTAAGYAEQNGCSALPDSTDLPNIDPNDGTTITKFTYSDCEEGAEVVFYRVNNGGHVWEGTGPVPPLFQPVLGAFVNRDIHASSEIWNFFARHAYPDPAPVPQLLEKTVIVDSLERSYLLYVPAAYDGSEAWPLVFNLHGAGSNARQQMFISGMNEVADTAHFLLVYPEGILNPAGTNTGWNVSLAPERQDDVQFFSKMIDAIASEYQVDLSSVYSTGMSNGGGMSFTLSCVLSDRIAAVATVSSPGILEDCNPGRPVPFLYMHGTADVIVPFKGGQSPVIPQEFPPARDRVQFWLEHNGCTGDPVITNFPDINTADSSTVTLERYTNCEASSEIAFYVIEGGGHTWPDGPPVPPGFEILGNVNRDINASSEIWNFFARHQHPDPAPVAQLLEKTIMVDTLEREYLLYIPADYDGSEEWPLVLNFHGYGGTPEGRVSGSKMNAVADTAHFLIAYPAGLTVDPSSIDNLNPVLPTSGAGWNIFGALSDNDDLGFINQLIDQVGTEYNLQQERVYATGLSFGGIMSQYLACALNDRIAAVASVAGSFLEDERFDCNPGRPLPVLHIHGTADPIVPFDGTYSGVSADSTIQFWRTNNGCAMDSTVTTFEDVDMTDGSTATRITYQDCSGESEVWFYRIDGGGHTWPGGPPAPPFLGNVNMDINASSEIWNFFNRFTLQTTSQPTLSASELALQVFPNPFSTQLTFTFELPESARVQLSIFNQLGQEVQRLADQRMAKGAHRIDWNTTARQLPAGMYYYRLRVGDRFVSRPVVVSE